MGLLRKFRGICLVGAVCAVLIFPFSLSGQSNDDPGSQGRQSLAAANRSAQSPTTQKQSAAPEAQSGNRALSVRIEILNTSEREIDLAECADQLPLSAYLPDQSSTIAPGETLVILGDPTNISAILALCERVLEITTGELGDSESITNRSESAVAETSYRSEIQDWSNISGLANGGADLNANPLSLMILPNNHQDDAWQNAIATGLRDMSRERGHRERAAAAVPAPPTQANEEEENAAAMALVRSIPEPTLLSCIFVLILATVAGLFVRLRSDSEQVPSSAASLPHAAGMQPTAK